MKKHDTDEMQMLNHALQAQINHTKTLSRNLENARMGLAYVRKMVDMSKI